MTFDKSGGQIPMWKRSKESHWGCTASSAQGTEHQWCHSCSQPVNSQLQLTNPIQSYACIAMCCISHFVLISNCFFLAYKKIQNILSQITLLQSAILLLFPNLSHILTTERWYCRQKVQVPLNNRVPSIVFLCSNSVYSVNNATSHQRLTCKDILYLPICMHIYFTLP